MTLHYSAAFVNALAEEGTKAEAIEWLQEIWNRQCELEALNIEMAKALKRVVADIHDYERVNNLAPNPPRIECWDSVAHAIAVIAKGKARAMTLHPLLAMAGRAP